MAETHTLVPVERYRELERADVDAAELVKALRAAVDVAKAWHGDVAWDIYYAHAPEMKLVREALAKHPEARPHGS